MNTPIILGIDEVGRGPWAGPLVVGAVILDDEFKNLPVYAELADSKKLSKKKRLILSQIILEQAAASATGWVSAEEIDQYHLSASLKLATRRAVKQILQQKIPFTEIIIDGTSNFLQNTPLENQVTILKKADSLIKEVSAASIIAKVARDNYMEKLALAYPHYGFEQHVGYGTAKHKSAIKTHGICPEHRTSFRPIREIITQDHPEITQNQSINSHKTESQDLIPDKTSPSTTIIGRHAEELVAKHLETLGHTIIAHNFKTQSYEIDLVSTKDGDIFFTEVKYRQNDHHGSALEQVTPTKHRQMQYAAEKFLSTEPGFTNFQPQLAVAALEGESPKLKTWFVL